jgi:hypothetical protein
MRESNAGPSKLRYTNSSTGTKDRALQPRAGNVDVKVQGNTGTLEFGGGVDARPLIQFKGVPLLKDLPIGGRFEVRNFYFGQPHYGVETRGEIFRTISRLPEDS